ncbi:MAG: alkylhydroperoxidase [Alphaproteobacteria bacterium HGW-Alphaproteobacteria-2]|nr:MAG: alkylhydroperoxidase [Alphaproteobacteria bacterium HGW-Alphaproteobacteria-2]
MTWIATIAYEDADNRLKPIYDRIRGADGHIDNIMMAHSLRPHTMEGHMALYKSVLHHARNATPKWFLEALGVWVSLINRCGYCVAHHSAGLSRLVEPARAEAILAALEAGETGAPVFDGREAAALGYAAALTATPPATAETHVAAMRAAGWEDAGILEVNQVVAYFAYANRTVLGLGCSTAGEPLGHAPGNSADPGDWRHE